MQQLYLSFNITMLTVIRGCQHMFLPGTPNIWTACKKSVCVLPVFDIIVWEILLMLQTSEDSLNFTEHQPIDLDCRKFSSKDLPVQNMCTLLLLSCNYISEYRTRLAFFRAPWKHTKLNKYWVYQLP